MRQRTVLVTNTTVAPESKPANERYVRELPACCLGSFNGLVMRGSESGRRLLSFGCPCGERWIVTSSRDPRVLDRFVTHAGPRVRAGGRAAA
jgi:hypothetical protein